MLTSLSASFWPSMGVPSGDWFLRARFLNARGCRRRLAAFIPPFRCSTMPTLCRIAARLPELVAGTAPGALLRAAFGPGLTSSEIRLSTYTW